MYDDKVPILLVGHKIFEKKLTLDLIRLKFPPNFELFGSKNDHKHTKF